MNLLTSHYHPNDVTDDMGRKASPFLHVMYTRSDTIVSALTPLDTHTANAAWNNSFRKVFNACWRESVNPLLYYCNDMPFTYLIDMRKITFYKKLMRNDNSIMQTLFNIARVEINAIYAKNNIVLNRNSAAVIKDRIWRTFVDNDSRASFN